MQRLLFLLTFVAFSTNAQQQIPLGETFYWKKNSTEKVLALNFLVTPKLVCDLYQLGPEMKNEKVTFEVIRTTESTFALYDTTTNSVQGNVVVRSDSMIVLTFGGAEFNMTSAKSQERLFNLMKSRFSLSCIKSSEISFNGIVAHETSVIPFLNRKDFNNRNESITDEIYGSTDLHYLESHGNRFYYITRGSEEISTK